MGFPLAVRLPATTQLLLPIDSSVSPAVRGRSRRRNSLISRESIISFSMPPCGGTTKDENAHSPPLEGRRGGLSRTAGPTPKADAFSPPKRGFSREPNGNAPRRLIALSKVCLSLPTTRLSLGEHSTRSCSAIFRSSFL